MQQFWAKISNNFVVEELLEYRQTDSVADFEAEGYCITEIANKFHKTLHRDYNKFMTSANRKGWKLRNNKEI